jgi:hypothetical protein
MASPRAPGYRTTPGRGTRERQRRNRIDLLSMAIATVVEGRPWIGGLVPALLRIELDDLDQALAVGVFQIGDHVGHRRNEGDDGACVPGYPVIVLEANVMDARPPNESRLSRIGQLVGVLRDERLIAC